MAIDPALVKVPRRMDDEERSVLAIKICNKDRELRRLKARVKEENDRLDTLRGQWDSGIIEEDAQQELPLEQQEPAFANGTQDQQPEPPLPAGAGSEPNFPDRPEQPPVRPIEPLETAANELPPQQDDTAEMEQALEDGLVDAPRPVDGETGTGREPGTRDDGSRPF